MFKHQHVESTMPFPLIKDGCIMIRVHVLGAYTFKIQNSVTLVLFLQNTEVIKKKQIKR